MGLEGLGEEQGGRVGKGGLGRDRWDHRDHGDHRTTGTIGTIGTIAIILKQLFYKRFSKSDRQSGSPCHVNVICSKAF